MKAPSLKKNSWYLIISLFSGFFRALGESLRTLWKGTSGLTQTHFMESLHFFFVVWPRQFWKKPSGLGIGRSFGSIIAFICTKERIFEQTRKPKGVTIIELIIALTLLSAVLIMAFTSFGNITVLRNLVTGRIDVNEQLYGAVERLVTTIKEGGGIDYEEYFNRNLIGSTLSGGHYQDFSGYGNYGRGGILGSSVFGSGGYICRSSTLTDIMNPTTGCITPSLNTQGLSQTGVFQRYGSYRSQFIDANSDASNDTALCVGRGIPGRERGDSDCNGKILGDEDDEDLGNGPAALQSWLYPELYLQRKVQTTHDRLFLRRRVERDPDAPPGAPCDTLTGTGTGCIGRLEIRKLRGRDLGIAHSPTTPSEGQFDGITDTWICHPDFSCNLATSEGLPLPTGDDSEWIPLLSPDIDLRTLLFSLSPSKDFRYAWRWSGEDTTVSGMVRLTLTIGYSWKKRKLLKVQNPEVTTSTSISIEN